MKKVVFLSHFDLNLYLFRLPIMKELLKKNIEVIALVPKGEFCYLLEKEGVKVVNYNFQRGSLNVFHILNTINELIRILKELSPDLLHTFTHQPNIYGTIAGKYAKVDNIFNLIEGLGSYFINNSLGSKLIRFIIKKLYKNIFKISKKVFFVNSDDPNYFLKKKLLDKSQVIIIKSVGIDTNKFTPIPKNQNLLKELNISADKPVILMIARVIKDKGVEEYIKAAEILKDKAEFLYIGDIDKGNKNAFTPDWKNVKYLGFKNNVKDFISISDIVVLPSYREGVPRTLLEAASMAKPIVTTNAPGCKEVVENGKNGFLVPIKDYKSLAEKIEVLIEDKNLREKFGRYSRIKAVNEFDIKKVVDAYLKIYDEVLGN